MKYLPGDHLKVSRGLYTHHGIALGDGSVIHYSGEVARKRDATIRIDSLKAFRAGGVVEVVRYGRHDATALVLVRARARLGEDGYQLFGNNCEHFARWCKTGESWSEQVRDVAATGGGVAGGLAATGGAIGVVSAGGAVAGLSGAGVMSGLATVGATVGGGAVVGLAGLAALPAAVGVVATRAVLGDDVALPDEERTARAFGRSGALIGAVAGTAGSIATVSAAGTVAGLSGAGIASGLAAVGATVGGGMAAGAAVTIAAPAVAAVAVAAGIYGLVRWVTG